MARDAACGVSAGAGGGPVRVVEGQVRIASAGRDDRELVESDAPVTIGDCARKCRCHVKAPFARV